MPSQSNNQLTTQIVPVAAPATTPGLNSDIQNIRTHANQPWTVRVCQTLNTQTIPYNTLSLVGFDTLQYNTYQAISTPIYSLMFGSITVSGKVYPYTNITVPQLGLYQVSSLVTLANGGDAIGTHLLFINKNGSPITECYLQFPIPYADNLNSIFISDTFECNPGDKLAMSYLQATSAGGNPALPLVTSSTTTYMVVRYLGLN